MALHNTENFSRLVEGWKENLKEVWSLRNKIMREGGLEKIPACALWEEETL